ncbi:MAG: TonB-dependent receptor, partial [Flavobacteriaceae bacterium]|nr:TonB-dependent receptor [Flavobacteriaceae bacterium]
MKKLFTLFLIGFVQLTFSQNSSSIVGQLTDKDYNNEPLAFANIIIKGTATGTTSDIDGLYALNNIQPGSYTLVISFLGYDTIEIAEVNVVPNKITTVNVALSANAASLDQVIIKTTTKKESEVALLLEQKKAVIIKESIGSEELSRKGISDAAVAVSKIAGVSKQEGGNNVYVRGLGDRYLNTTYNGLSLPSNDIEKKNIDLSLFTSDIIQNVSISKAYTSNFYGDFTAGNVNILSKDYSGKGFIETTISTGMNTRSSGKDFVRNEGTGYFGFYKRYNNDPFAVILSHGVDPVNAGNPINISGTLSGGASHLFENNSKLSFFLTASFDNDFEYRKGTAVDFTTVEKKRFPNAEEYEYSTTTSAMANLIYKVNSNHKLSYNSLFINSTNDEVGYYGINGEGSNRDAILNTDKGFYQMNAQFEQDLIFVNQIMGSHSIDDSFKIDWGIGYNKVFAHQPDRKRISVENYDYALDNDATSTASFFNNIAYDNQRYFQDIEDKELNSRFNIKYSASEKIGLNFGYNGRTKERSFKNIRYGYDFIEPNTPVLDVHNLDAIFNAQNLGTVYNTEVFRPIDPDGGIDNTNFPGLYENTYHGKLDIHALYVNSELNLNDKWLFVPGIRFETFKQNIEYNVINLTSTDPGYRNSYENFFLPSLNVRYKLSDDQNLRFSFSNTVSLPEFKEVAPYVYEDVTQRIGGNPDLLKNPSYSEVYNIDLKYEWFFGKNELFSITAFAKQINDPINKVIANDATGTQRYFRTGDKAEVFGGEIEVRKNLLLDEEEEAKLSVGFNATYMHTQQDLKSSNGLFSTTFNRSEEELQGASPLLLNADLFYSPTFNNYKPSMNMVFAYFSDRIDAIGSGQLGNIIEKGIPTLNFIW